MSEHSPKRPRTAWLDSLVLTWLMLGGAIGATLTLHRAGVFLPLRGSGLLELPLHLAGLEGRGAVPTLHLTALASLVYVVPVHGLRVLLACASRTGRWPRRIRGAFTAMVLAIVPLSLWLGEPAPGASISTRIPPRLAGFLKGRFPAPPVIDEDTRHVEGAIVRATNRARAARSLEPLSFDTALSEVARAHSVDMSRGRYFAHRNPRGEDATARAERAGYPTERRISRDLVAVGIAENIGLSAPSIALPRPAAIAEHLVEHWLESPGHRDNLLNPNFQDLGVGVAFDGLRYAATQNFR